MSDVLRAVLWMSGAITSFTLMAIAGRAAALDFDTFEIMFYRSLTGILIIVSIALVRGKMGDMKTDRLGLHTIRNVAHFTGQNLWFYAITVIPLAQVFSLEFTAPIWVMILSPLFLGEPFRKIGVLCAALGFVGVLIVARPTPETLNLGVLAAALAAIAFAFSAIFTRKLTRTEPILRILFYLTTLQAIFGAVCAGYDLDFALPTLNGLPWLVLIGCAGLLAHFCLTTALSIAPATIVIPIDFTRLPIIAVVAMFLYGEALDIWVFVGAALIFAANWLNISSSTKART